MSPIHRVGLLLLCGIAFLLGNAWQDAGAQGEKTKEVQKWEYKRIVAIGHIHAEQLAELNRAGEEGWEVVATTNTVALLKRAKQ